MRRRDLLLEDMILEANVQDYAATVCQYVGHRDVSVYRSNGFR